MFKDDKFNFWCPIGRIEKATDEAGEPVMRIGGIASTMDKDADKGDIEKGGDTTRISLRENPRAVASLLDQASFAKGYDKEYGDALLAFEARPADGLPKTIIARLKAETGYEVVE